MTRKYATLNPIMHNSATVIKVSERFFKIKPFPIASINNIIEPMLDKAKRMQAGITLK